jgi:DNA-binding CsgD family transcriptional regulator
MAGSVIRTRRAREAMGLVRQVHEIGVPSEPARKHLVGGLLRLVGAGVGVAVRDEAYAPGRRGGLRAFTLAGFDDTTRYAFDRSMVEGCSSIPYERAVMDAIVGAPTGHIVTGTNEGVVPRALWDRSPWVNEGLRAVRLDHYLGSALVLGTELVENLAFCRAVGDRAFSTEDREVVRLVHLGVGHLFEQPSPRESLSRREKEALDCLLSGAADKEIAAQLGISLHTAREYVKAVYKAYGVSGRTELIARFARRQW